MARVTRSKRIDIAEDHTSFTIAPEQLPDAVIQTNPLAEIASTNTMQDPVAAELRGLKAAYRTAIGGTRKGGKKSKKQKKSKVDSSTEGGEDDAESMNAASAISPVPEATRQLLQSREDEKPKEEEKVVQALAPAGRTTRRQAVKAQAGQYTSYLFGSNQGRSGTGKPAEFDFITSLFGGRSLGRKYGRAMADQHMLAEEALSKPTNGSLKKTDAETSPTNNVVEKPNNQKDRVVIEEEAFEPSSERSPARSPTRSPVKTLAEVQKDFVTKQPATLVSDVEEDSFVEQIIARSPAKPVSRIEDSVEALDQLEEALEALDQATLAERIVSPEKTRQNIAAQQSTPRTALDDKALMDRSKAECDARAKALRLNSTKQQSSKPGYASMRVKATVPKAPVVKKATSMVFKPASNNDTPPQEEPPVPLKPKVPVTKRPMSMIVNSRDVDQKVQVEPAQRAPIKRPISLQPPKETVRSTKPVTKATFELPGEAIARKLKEQREARLAQRESSEDSFHTARAVSGAKIKSTKPPTTSTFELPGEAVSQRKREAHEARLKAQEEEERKRREFKAKPLRKSVVPNVIPRDTVASRARQSRIGLENIIESSSGTSTLKRGSNVGTTVSSNIGAHRPSLSQLNTANTSAPRAPGPAPTLTRKPSATTASGLSMSGRAMQRTVSATEVQVQRQRAKEIYNRDARLAEDIERERREREASAKRAREEAAERGRQASREWAEKQIAKKLAEGDKGMSAGYGAGGQLGLKG